MKKSFFCGILILSLSAALYAEVVPVLLIDTKPVTPSVNSADKNIKHDKDISVEKTFPGIAEISGKQAAELQKKESVQKYLVKEDPSASVEFREVWGYLMRGEERLFKGNEPVTDICYFSCTINSRGRLNMNVEPPVIPDLNGKKRRIHMVISDLTNTGLMHYTMNPKYGVRDLLVADIIELSKKFDGVQIDFEAVADRDGADFREFLRLVKAGMEPGKIFSVALPSRVSALPGDAYDYSIISGIVDRVFIMAYDQHWSTSKPGPVASLTWCRNIITYAKQTVPADKLIMGIPLYGREWKEKKIKARTVKVKEYKTVKAANSKKGKTKKKVVVRTVKIPARVEVSSRSVRSCNLPDIESSSRGKKEYSVDKGLTMKIKYSKSSNGILYCDDVKATKEKFLLYREFVDSVGFWRLGMQDPALWKEIRVVD